MRVHVLLCLVLLSACSKSAVTTVTGAVPGQTQAQAVGSSTPASTPASDLAVAAPAPAAAGHADGIAWRRGDVDGAFAEARAAKKPVFLYWGATWCPPCNQVKATIFNRQDFIERSRAFVAVYIDGDSPNAQQLGDRFKVSGYPSMLLFNSDGTEITRLPGEVEAARYMEVLTTSMNGGKPVRSTLQAALRGETDLSEQDWRMLAYYSWETDEQQLIPKGRLPDTLLHLARTCPRQFADPSARLALQALNARAVAAPKGTVDPEADSDYALLTQVLGDPKASRNSFDLLTDSVGATVRYATKEHSAERQTLVRAWDAMLEKASEDTTLSQADRLGAVDARIELARASDPKAVLALPLIDEIRRQVSRADRETSDGYERQSVINSAAETLADAGLLDASDTLLKAELTRSHAPYYYMVGLSRNAKTRGDKSAAIDWLAQAYAASEGPATRLQWGVIYIRGLIELTPDDEARIERTSETVIGELAGNPDVLYERNRASLARLGQKLDEWNKSGRHRQALTRIRATLVPICNQATPEAGVRTSCERLFDGPGKSA